MKALLTILLCLVFCPCVASAQEKTGSVEQTLLQLRREFWEAASRIDLAAVERFVSDEYMETESTGEVSTKADLIVALKELAKVPASMLPPWPVIDDVKVRVYGDTAIMTGRSTFQLKEIEHFRFTEVYVKQKGQWRLVASQSTLITRK